MKRRKEKRAMIEPNHKRLSLRRQCELIGLPRSSYYREPGPETEQNLELMSLIDEEYTRHPYPSHALIISTRLPGPKTYKKHEATI